MSRIRRAQELAEQVLGTNRASRNQQYIRNIPQNRARNLAQQVLKTPRRGGLVAAGQSMRNIANSDAVGYANAALLAGGGAMLLSQTDPNDLGRQLAQIDQPFYELIGKVQESASDLAEIPQVYFMQVKQAYDDEIQKQQELQNIKEFGDPMGAPVEVPPSIEDQAIKPVSVFMAGGGSADVRDILGESGRTMSGIDRAIAAGMGSPMMSDNEPRMEDRDQVFSIEAKIQNLLKSYQMFIDDQDFDRAQQVANEINMLDVQKKQAQAQQANAQAQAQRDPQEDEISRILDSISI